MKAILSGFLHMSGIAKQSGKPFDMRTLIVLVPAQNAASEKFNKLGVGYEVAELPVADSAKPAFMSLTYPCHAQLDISHEIFNGKMQPTVNGVSHVVLLKPVDKAAA
ncbi:hypothetical protein [Chromobacterium haemolyticum]|uniref:hypothetical protein n=1 Tax=Chromobacterium haemolyticum TaxID=394935 RepID=UPI00307DC612